jgi:hypothetical protein
MNILPQEAMSLLKKLKHPGKLLSSNEYQCYSSDMCHREFMPNYN